MYNITLNNAGTQNYFNTLLVSSNKTHYISVYVSETDNNPFFTIAKSDDGFNFTSPCKEASDLKIDSKNSLKEIYEYIINHFQNKGYQLYSQF